MATLFEKYLANRFQDFKGSTVSAKVVVQESSVNELLMDFLNKNPQTAGLITKAAIRTNGPLTVEIDVQV